MTRQEALQERNTYEIMTRVRNDGRHQTHTITASDIDTAYAEVIEAMKTLAFGEPYDMTSMKLDGEQLLVDERGRPITDSDRMTLSCKRSGSRKAATSILRDWLNPNSWSTGTLRASAAELIRGDLDWHHGADLHDLTRDQRAKLALIAGGIEPRPPHPEGI